VLSRSLWRNRDFVWLIGGQTVSEFGSAISGFAVPWLLLQLTGSALQMGLVFGVGFIPYLLLSLPAGAWADRYNRKRLMFWADVSRFILIGSIPLAGAFHVLFIGQLYVVQALTSAASALFDAAYVSCLPNVVDKNQLQQANSVLQSGASASQLIGPGLAGALVAVLGASTTIAFDACSFAFSSLSLLFIRRAFSAARESAEVKKLWSGIGEGLHYVWHHNLIRTISVFTMCMNIGSSATGAVILFKIADEMHVSSFWAGIIMSSASVGTIAGSLLSSSLGGRMAMSKIMLLSLIGMSFPAFVIGWTSVPWLIAAAEVVVGFCGVMWNVQSISLRQSVIPDALLGRASASIRLVVWGSIPVGSAFGGALANRFGSGVVFIGSGVIQVGLLIWGKLSPALQSAVHPTVDVESATG